VRGTPCFSLFSHRRLCVAVIGDHQPQIVDAFADKGMLFILLKLVCSCLSRDCWFGNPGVNPNI
jgi:hypothetical protein